jgi:2,4-dienoyl-CoA reductase (NADPH2)
MGSVNDFEHLLRPGTIGTMTVRNRVVMSPMETMSGTPEGLPSERTRDYFAARAAGGVGLITVGATTIDPQNPETPGGLQIGTDASIDAHRALVDAVHEHGARIQPQIVHAGPDGLGPELYGSRSLGPSVIPSYLTGRPSEEISVAEFGAIVDLYKAAVRRVVEAGYDGIELHAAHGYMLLGSFLAPQRNRRTDDYAGHTVEGRMRAVFEVLAAIRAEIGDALPITLRVSGYERVAGGRPIDETARVAPLLAAAGVDAFHVSGGVIDRLVTRMVNGAHDPDGLNVGAAAAVKQVVDVPVIAVGRIHDPAFAERILAEGRADFVAMGRPLLADARLVEKVGSGRADRVRRCISCENCIDALERVFSAECAVNPRTGRERELAVEPAARAKRVVVVGGGPGGMEAARVASMRGHEVVLHEAAAQLGGALVWASMVHPENAPFLAWLRAELAQADVDVHLGHTVTADDVVAMAPDAVVVATGGRVTLPAIPGADLPHVHGLCEVLADGVGLGARVAVVGAGLAALQLAEFLAEGGHRLAVLGPSQVLAPEVGLKRRTEHMDRLDRLGVTVNTDIAVVRIEPEAVVVVPAGGTERTIAADSVVLAGEVVADLGLHDDLRARVPEVHAVGDCAGFGLIRKATEDGARAACAI